MKMKKLPYVLALTFLSSCASMSHSGSGEVKSMSVIPLVGTFKVHRYSLDNGLKLLVVEDHSSPTFAYETWYGVGSRNEVKGRTGLAHLFEHLMFKGTTRHPEGELDKIMDSAGAEGQNAFTTHNYTAYVQELPSDKLDLIAGLESDRMVNLIVNEKSFRTELDVVQNERRFRNENNPDGLMYQDIFDTAFKQHPYHWPVIGYQEDLNRMSAEDARAFYKDYYSPNHATVVVVGDVAPDKVLHLIEKYYGTIPAQNVPAHEIPIEPAQKNPQFKTLKLNIQVQKLLLGYHIPGVEAADVPAINVLQSILTGGKSSRLYLSLVNRGIATSVDAYDIDDKDPSLFILTTSLQKGKTAHQAENVILSEIKKLKTKFVSDQELERARNRLNFNFLEGLSTNNEKAQFLGRYETLEGAFEKGVHTQDLIQKVTAAQIQAVVKTYFKPGNRTVIVGVAK